MVARKKASAGKRGPVRPKGEAFEVPLAREMWVEHQASAAAVCAAADIGEATLEAWRKEFGWDGLRTEAAQSWATALIPLRRKLAAVALELEGMQTPAELETTLRLLRALVDNATRIRKLERDSDFRKHALRFWRELFEYLKPRDLEALKALEPHVRQFTHTLARGS